ncbi:hypothetical protein LAD77_01855 [Klebsiella pneumoniae]|nr:hypothetical protein [Klebsiella pneumoniae]
MIDHLQGHHILPLRRCCGDPLIQVRILMTPSRPAMDVAALITRFIRAFPAGNVYHAATPATAACISELKVAAGSDRIQLAEFSQ